MGSNPGYAQTGRYTQLCFGDSLADPVVLSTEVITIHGPSLRDFDDDGYIDVLGVMDGALTLLQVVDEEWAACELPTLSGGFATGSFDTVPGMDLLVTDGEDPLLVRSFATDPSSLAATALPQPDKRASTTRRWSLRSSLE